jgi:hypothetical protein
MVRKQAKNGASYHEPPYTWEESRDFYRAMGGGPVTVVHAPVREAEAPQIASAAGKIKSFSRIAWCVATAGGGSWYPSNVRNVLARG